LKKLYCFIAIAVLICGLPVQADALTKGQQSIGNIGVKITWFDFGKAYKNYDILDNTGTDFYTLKMSNDSTGVVKTGFVNGKGEIVIEPATEQEGSFGSEGDTFNFTSHQGNTLIYGDADGIRALDVSAYSSIDSFRDGYASVTFKSKANKGVIDKLGNLIFEDKSGKYKGFTYLGSGIFAAEIEVNKYDFLDNTGALLSKAVYTNDWLRSVSEERLSASRDGKYGFLDLSGNEVIPFIYDEAYSFQEGLAAVCKDGKWGFIDKDGMEVISTVYDQVDSSFHNGLAAACLNGKWGLIDKGGNTILPFEYDEHIYAEEGGFHIARKDGKTIILDGDGNLISDEYSYMRKEPDGRIFVSKNVNGSEVSAYLDQDNKILTGFKEFILYPLGDQLYLGKKSGDYPPGVVPPHDYSQKFAILDSDGNNLTGFKYSNIRWGDSFWNGFQIVNQQYYNTAGLVNRNGAEVLPTIFNDIIITKEGYAFVTVNDPDTGGNTRVGYFKIPDQFAEIKGSRPITVYLNGVELYFDSDPVIKNQRTMVPLRKVFESLGQQVEWNESTKTITSKGGDKILKLTIGSNTASINGEEVRLDAEPFIQDGRTLVPLRFVAENLGAGVQWDGANRRVIITTDATN
jgi:Copper amine oxidase N-terminal domain.